MVGEDYNRYTSRLRTTTTIGNSWCFKGAGGVEEETNSITVNRQCCSEPVVRDRSSAPSVNSEELDLHRYRHYTVSNSKSKDTNKATIGSLGSKEGREAQPRPASTKKRPSRKLLR